MNIEHFSEVLGVHTSGLLFFMGIFNLINHIPEQ